MNERTFFNFLLYILYRHEVVWGSGGIASPFLTSALDGGEWSASRLGRFTSKGRAPNIHCIGGWVGPGAGLDAVELRQTCFCRECNPGRPAHTPSLYRPKSLVSLHIMSTILI
jgi:hypothetical protein